MTGLLEYIRKMSKKAQEDANRYEGYAASIVYDSEEAAEAYSDVREVHQQYANELSTLVEMADMPKETHEG